MAYKVVESFVSINGEGIKVGELAHFIRFAGCNLDCSYCDTQWANQKDVAYELMTKEEIHTRIKEKGIRNVTLTGGEPLLQENFDELLSLLEQDSDIQVEIETNGSMDIRDYKKNQWNHIAFTMDYKMESSLMEGQMCKENFSHLSEKDVVKFVVASREELEKAAEIINDYQLTERCNVLLSPVYGLIEPEAMVEFMKSRSLNGVKMQLQLHKIIWDPNQKGV